MNNEIKIRMAKVEDAKELLAFMSLMSGTRL